MQWFDNIEEYIKFQPSKNFPIYRFTCLNFKVNAWSIEQNISECLESVSGVPVIQNLASRLAPRGEDFRRRALSCQTVPPPPPSLNCTITGRLTANQLVKPKMADI